jgi:hypothetical protein
MAKEQRKKESSKMKLRKALEKWTEERCAEVLRYIELRDHPPKPDMPRPLEWDDYDDEFIDPK